MTNEEQKNLTESMIALGHKLHLEERQSVKDHYRVHLYAGLLYCTIVTAHTEIQEQRPGNPAYKYEWPHLHGNFMWPSDVAGNKSWAGW